MTLQRHLPAVDRLLALLPEAIACHGRQPITAAVRAELAAARAGARHGLALPDEATLLRAVVRRAEEAARCPLRPVHNLTGTVLHTNLGRACLPELAIEWMVAAARTPCTLEYDLQKGSRGERDAGVTALLRELLGPQHADLDATVVNNNAAAVLLALHALAEGREAVLSRGELVEIGGAFRIPDVMRRAQVRLVEVGTTNATHPRDYTEAITPQTALLMKVHTSNYTVVGFTSSVPESTLAALAHAAGLPLLVDLGSGTLTDFTALGLPHEPTVQQALAAGADIVTFSGDKLLGGPQAGLIVGRRDLIERIRRNPLKRALRVGKTTLAALQATLQLYRDPQRLTERLPALRLLTRPQAQIRALAERLQMPVQQALGARARVTVEDCASQIGSGALPIEHLPSVALVMRCPSGRASGRWVTALEADWRALPQPVIGVIREQAFWLDLRCLETAHEAAFIAQVAAKNWMDTESGPAAAMAGSGGREQESNLPRPV